MMACKKFHPGHYVKNVTVGDTFTGPESMNSYVENDVFTGVVIALDWVKWEVSQNNYSNTYVDNCLSWATTNDKYVIFMFMERDFGANGVAGNRAIPTYIKNLGLVTQFPNSHSGGSIANIWDATLNDHKIRALSALLDQYDSHPRFEGLAFQESALGGVNPSNTTGFSRDTYYSEIKRTIAELNEHAPTTLIHQYMMGSLPAPLGETLQEFCDFLVSIQTGATGIPDNVPWQADDGITLDKNTVWANIRDNITNVVHRAGGDTTQMLSPGYPKAGGGTYYDTFEDLVQLRYDHCVTQNGAHYQEWRDGFYSRIVGGEPYSSDYRDAQIAVLSTINHDTNTTAPYVVCGEEEPAEGGGVIVVRNVISNSDFTSGEDFWGAVNDGISNISGEQFHIVGTTATSPFNQLYQHNVATVAGTYYTLSFTARNADNSHPNLTAELLQHNSPYSAMGLLKIFTTTTSDAAYKTGFVATRTETDGRLRFRFTQGNFYIDNVVFQDDLAPVAPDEAIITTAAKAPTVSITAENIINLTPAPASTTVETTGNTIVWLAIAPEAAETTMGATAPEISLFQTGVGVLLTLPERTRIFTLLDR